MIKETYPAVTSGEEESIAKDKYNFFDNKASYGKRGITQTLLIQPNTLSPSYKLMTWQEAAIRVWEGNNCRGTVAAATGAGKTVIGLEAIRQHAGDTALIVVPTIALQQQWAREITTKLGIPMARIGFIGDGHNDHAKPITIAVINSIRDAELTKDLLILDELHHYGSDHNIEFLRKGTFKHILGLSATPERVDGRHEEIAHAHCI